MSSTSLKFWDQLLRDFFLGGSEVLRLKRHPYGQAGKSMPLAKPAHMIGPIAQPHIGGGNALPA